MLTESSGVQTVQTSTDLYTEFTDLNAYTQYSVTVKSINDENKEALSDPKTYNTTELGEIVCLPGLQWYCNKLAMEINLKIVVLGCPHLIIS